MYRVLRRSARKGKGRAVYTLSWHAGGKRQMRQFTDPEFARREAEMIAERLAAGRISAASEL